MKAPAFWWRPPGLAARLLRPAAAIYGRVTALRLAVPAAEASIPVICIGNFTVGGSGKTPTALHVAELLRSMGRRPAFLTRGYGGRLAGPIIVDPERHNAADVGDEPLLLARDGPTIVARDRPAGAAVAASLGADAIVMDDGLQNPTLRKDFVIAVVDGATGIGNGLPLPAGPLRAPLFAQWPLIDAVLVIGPGAPGDHHAAEASARARPVFRGRLVPDPTQAARLKGRRLLAFAGIGRPEKFFASLRGCGAEVVATRSFPDHHPYRPAELRRLVETATRAGLALVTTQKDAVRLAGLVAAEPGWPAIETLPVSLDISDPTEFAALLADRLAGAYSRT